MSVGGGRTLRTHTRKREGEEGRLTLKVVPLLRTTQIRIAQAEGGKRGRRKRRKSSHGERDPLPGHIRGKEQGSKGPTNMHIAVRGARANQMGARNGLAEGQPGSLIHYSQDCVADHTIYVMSHAKENKYTTVVFIFFRLSPAPPPAPRLGQVVRRNSPMRCQNRRLPP